MLATTQVAACDQAPERLETREGIDYDWYDPSPDKIDQGPRDKGYTTALLVASHEHERIGHLRITWADRMLVDELFAQPLAFKDRHQGWSLNLDAPPEQLWARVHLYAGAVPASMRAAGRNVSPWQLSAADAPDEARIRADLRVFEDEARVEIEHWFAGASFPFVAYVRVEDAWRRRGVGITLYELGARRLAGYGLALRASSLRSDEALAVWERLVGDEQYPTGCYQTPGGDVVPTLDYREM